MKYIPAHDSLTAGDVCAIGAICCVPMAFLITSKVPIAFWASSAGALTWAAMWMITSIVYEDERLQVLDADIRHRCIHLTVATILRLCFPLAPLDKEYIKFILRRGNRRGAAGPR